MGRWLPKAKMEERDKKVVELYLSGLSYKALGERFRLGTGAVTRILKKRGVKTNRMSRSKSRIEEGVTPKAGDEKLVEGLLRVWVVCPECGSGRWMQKGNVERPGYTGRCKTCYRKVAQQEIGTYYV